MPKADLLRRIDLAELSGGGGASRLGYDDSAMLRRDGTRSLYDIARWIWNAGAEVAGVFRAVTSGLKVFGRLFAGADDGTGAVISLATDIGTYEFEITDADGVAVFAASTTNDDVDDAEIALGRPGYPRIAFGTLESFDRRVPLVDARLVNGVLRQVTNATADSLLRLAFSFISWAGIGIIEAFEDETLRASPEPAAFPAVITNTGITNGGDHTVGRTFTWTSRLFSDVSDVLHSTSTAIGENYLEDTTATWFTDQYRNYELVDADDNVFVITTSTVDPQRLVVIGTPAAGAYTIRFAEAQTAVVFVLWDGPGDVYVEVEFDGVNAQDFLRTFDDFNLVGGAVDIADPGRAYRFRVQITNDASGDGPSVYGLGVFTDPAIWT